MGGFIQDGIGKGIAVQIGRREVDRLGVFLITETDWFWATGARQLTLRAKIGDENFVARGKTILSIGWKEVYENHFEEDDASDDLKEQILPRIEKGDTLNVKLIAQTSGQTKPPARFNEATLLSAMENPTKYMDTQNKQLADTLKIDWWTGYGCDTC